MAEEDKKVVVYDEVDARMPHRKADKVQTGRLSTWEKEGTCVFTANKERPELKREVIHDRCGVRLSKTQGDKESSYILTAKVDANSPDPVGELQSKVFEQLKGKAKKLPQIPNANFLIDEEDKLKVWHRKDKKQLCAFIVLDASRDKAFIVNELMENLSKVNRVISNKF